MSRFISWITLLAFFAGCSGLREVPLATDAPAATVPVEAGRRARVTLDDGTRHEGTIERVTETEIVLGKIGNYGKEEVFCARERIVRLEVEDPSWAQETVAWIAFGLVFALGVLCWGLSEGLDGAQLD